MPERAVKSLLVEGGEVLDRIGRRRADVLVEGDRVVAVGADLGGADRTLDAGGCVVTPGLVDIQVHFRTPGQTASEDVGSGARGAALGGVTACVMMPNTEPCIDDVDRVGDVLALAAGLPCDVRTSAAITVDRAGEQLVDFAALHAAGVRVFTDDGTAVADAGVMRRAFEATRALPGAVLAQHAEEPSLVEGGVLNEGPVAARLGVRGRPAEAEEIVVARDVALASLTGGRYHVLHLSTALALAHVRRAKASGLRVTAEVSPQHLVLTEDDVERLGTSGRMNPPLRTTADVEALRDGLLDGALDAIATDHAPHHPDLKARPLVDAPPGMLGVETALAVVLTHLVHPGVLPLERALALLSWQPAAVAGIGDHGRPVAPGEPAHLAVIDPEATWVVRGTELASLSDNTPWEGTTMRGRVRHTVLGGEPVVVDAALVARAA